LKALPLAAIALMQLLAGAANAQMSVNDDMGRNVQFQSPATRIVTLAPFLTELVYAAGAGDRVVGVSALSEYPPQAAAVTRVATGADFSLEQVAALKPDLVLAWREGIRREYIDAMSRFGATVFVASARQLEDVPRLLKAIGVLTGKDVSRTVAAYEAKLESLRRENANKPQIPIFVEIWNRPLTTISGQHFINQALEICHGQNVFQDLPGSLPQITWEELYQRDPYVIVGAGSADNRDEFVSNWSVRRGLTAVVDDRLVYIDVDTIQRPTPRTPDAIALLCAGIDTKRPAFAQAPAVAPAPAPSAVPQARPAEPPAPAPQGRPSQYGM
jgi:iron complex transport system substrate-binding protein